MTGERMTRRPAARGAQATTGRVNMHKSTDTKKHRKNSQMSREGGGGPSPETAYTQVALKPEARAVGSKSRSRDHRSNVSGNRNTIVPGSTLSAGKISRQQPMTSQNT